MQTFLRRPFAGRERTFQLRFGEAAELERLCNAGIGAIMVRLATHQFYTSDIREPIRLGLQGGGMSEPEATALIMGNVDGKPLAGPHLELACDIIGAYVNGIPDEIKKKAAPSRPRTPRRRATSASGTASAAQ
jgi:hypothetical protein